MPTTPSDLDGQSDEDLRGWIVEARAEWQKAYHALFHERYGSVIKSAVEWTGKRHGVRLRWEEVIEELFLNLHGTEGTWSGLNSWTPDRGSLSGWLWVVVRNVCYRLIRRAHRFDDVERVNPTDAFDDSDPGVTPIHREPTAEDVVTVTMLLERVSPDCARLLRWKYYHGMTDEDIARRQEVGREWANRKRRRCERSLADVLRQEGLTPSDFNF